MKILVLSIFGLPFYTGFLYVTNVMQKISVHCVSNLQCKQSDNIRHNLRARICSRNGSLSRFFIYEWLIHWLSFSLIALTCYFEE